MVWHALKEARTQKSNLAVIWLDVANAYRSIPHKMIVFALHRYCVSPQWIRFIETYYKGMFSKSFSQSATSSWHRHQDQPEVLSSIPSIHFRPMKCLGRIIDGSISDRNSSVELTDKLLAGLSVIDKSHFIGTQKRWILQHLLIIRIQ